MALEPSEIQVKIEKSPVPPNKWDYQTYKEFLLSQSRGKDFLLPIDQFAREIELSSDWHGVLNSMRDRTGKNYVERVALVGYNTANRTIYLPYSNVAIRSFGKYEWGDYDQVVNPILVEMQRISASGEGIDGFVGLLHSHPYHKRTLRRVLHRTVNRLSAGDLYNVLRGSNGSLGGVADGPINSFAFRTRESVSPRESAPAFYDLWERDPPA